MNEEDQRRALAEWMGWQHCHGYDATPDDLELPDTNSLDVLHEMWCKLNKKEHAKFRLCLEFVVQRDGHIYGPCKSLSNASSSQRREALLRTLNLWKETCPKPDATAQ